MTAFLLKSPVLIIIIGTGNKSIAARAANNMWLTLNESKLLLFYCSCSNRFTPARTLIARELELSVRQIVNLRNSLASKNMIGLYKEFIILDWNRLRLYSTIPKSLTKGAWTAPIIVRDSHRKELDLFQFKLLPVEKQVQLVASMTDKSYSLFCKLCKSSVNIKANR